MPMIVEPALGICSRDDEETIEASGGAVVTAMTATVLPADAT